MSDLQILLRLNEKVIGRASNIKISDVLKNDKEIKLSNFKIIEDINPIKDELIEIDIVFKNKVYSRFEFRLSQNLPSGNNSVIKGNVDLSFYNQDVIDIFSAWDNNKKLSWRDLGLKKKKAWLVACLYWSGVPKSIKQEINFVFDGIEVDSVASFYCLLGEKLAGERGYFGQDLDGLEDCILGAQTDRISSRSITFKNFDKLKLVLNKEKSGYVETVLEIFQNHGFKTIIN